MKPFDALQKDLTKVLKVSGPSRNLDFYISALTEFNPFYNTEEVVAWLSSLNGIEYFNVRRVPFDQMEDWYFEEPSGNLRHRSGRFFSIQGLHVQTNRGPVLEWTQPIIDQPEIGILGVITKKLDGILYFLVQAKAEPGNINTFQISPTVQATHSNYTRVHGGKSTPFLEYFLGHSKAEVLVDQLQSEQGARFYQKRNRNIIVRIADDEEILAGPLFRWVTLGQLIRLIHLDNTVNMDLRSVLSSISYDPEEKNSLETVNAEELKDCLNNSSLVNGPVSDLGVQLMLSCHANTKGLLPTDQILLNIARQKFSTELITHIIPLNQVQGWIKTDQEISHVGGKYFSIIGVKVETTNREVRAWSQPIMQQRDSGLIGFVMKNIEGVLHLLVQLKLECGNMDLLELAPTVQCITDSYLTASLPPYVEDCLKPRRVEIISDTMQSEEGGRFYRESNRNVLMIANEGLPVEQGEKYLWMTVSQIKQFIKFSNFLNVEARSVLSALPMVS